MEAPMGMPVPHLADGRCSKRKGLRLIRLSGRRFGSNAG
jgi:hypothetical protein